MSHENEGDPSAALQAAHIKIRCIELLALAGDYRDVMPQVLELLRQYYAAKQVRFCAGGEEADVVKKDSLGANCVEADSAKADGAKADGLEKGGSQSLEEPEGKKTGDFAAPVIFDGKLYGKLMVEQGSAMQPEAGLLEEIGHVLAAEIWKKKVQEYLLHLSYLDQLTGIRNNTSYIRMLEYLLAHPAPVGIAFADLNGLKYLNDTYGHEYGDQALKHLANVCREYFSEDQLYRISGDEFVVICPEMQEAEFIRQAKLLKERLKLEEQELAAFGYLWDSGSTGADKLLHRAERLMYQEKKLHYQESTRRVQECPGYAEALLRQYGRIPEEG